MDGWMDGWVAQMVAKGWQHFSLKTALILNYQVDSPASWTKQTADAELRKTEALCNGNETSIKVAHRAANPSKAKCGRLQNCLPPVNQSASLPVCLHFVLSSFVATRHLEANTCSVATGPKGTFR